MGLLLGLSFGLVAESVEFKEKLINNLVKNGIEVRPIVSGNIARQYISLKIIVKIMMIFQVLKKFTIKGL